MQTISPQSSAPLTNLLGALRRRRNSIAWSEWLPIITLDAATPGTWFHSFNALPVDEQCDVLDLLLRPDAGPLSNVLLIGLAAQADQIEDEQVRQTILHEVASAWEASLDAVKHQLKSLKSNVSNFQKRESEAFDLAANILESEGELAELRANEFEMEEAFSRLHALESNCQDLERRKRTLALYDFKKSEERVQTLQSELEQGEVERAELESAIQSLDTDLKRLRADVDSAKVRQTVLQPEVAGLEAEQNELRSSVADAQALITQLRDSNATARARKKELEAEQQTLQTQADNIAAETSEWTTKCNRERERLEQLQRDAESAQRTDISDKISEVFQLLPADRADEGFHATAGSRS